MRQQVETLIEEWIRPLVEADGGVISLVSVDDTTITLRLGAACAGCPGAHYTRTEIITPLLQSALGDEFSVVYER